MRTTSIALGTVLALGAAVAGPAAASDLVPFRGEMSGTATITPIAPPVVSVLLQTSGHANQLGSFTLVAPHTVNQSTLTATGTYTFTAADGSTLTATLAGTAALVAPGQLSISEEGVVTGGTGRFAGARGSFSTQRTFFPGTGQTHGTFEGWISTPGR